MVNEGPGSWSSLDISYEPPRVERLWRQVGEDRLYLHFMHPCEKALVHPHQWASAVAVLSGEQEMTVFVPSGAGHEEVVRTVLREGSVYEMTNPRSMHSVRPLRGPSLSMMMTAPPFKDQVFDHSRFGKAAVHARVPPERQEELLMLFVCALIGRMSERPAL